MEAIVYLCWWRRQEDNFADDDNDEGSNNNEDDCGDDCDEDDDDDNDNDDNDDDDEDSGITLYFNNLVHYTPSLQHPVVVFRRKKIINILVKDSGNLGHLN